MNSKTTVTACFAATLMVILNCSGGDSGPCAMKAVMSCTNSDMSGCHEFYSQDAANAVTPDCVSMGSVIANEPCSTSFPDCCVQQNGSFGNPEGICLPSGGWSGSNGGSTCAQDNGTLCTR